MTPLSMVVSFLSSVEGLEVTLDVVPHRLLGQGFFQQGMERSQLLRRKFGQRQRQVIGDGPFGVERTGKRQLMRNRTGSENLTLAIPSPHSIPWHHGNPAGITTRGVGMDPTRGASLYSGAGSACGDLDIHGPRVTGAG